MVSTSWSGSREIYAAEVAVVLIVTGAVCVVFTFLLAFTIYGIGTGLVGVLCLVLGVAALGRKPPRSSSG